MIRQGAGDGGRAKHSIQRQGAPTRPVVHALCMCLWNFVSYVSTYPIREGPARCGASTDTVDHDNRPYTINHASSIMDRKCECECEP
jgi:hypothetical protein